MKINLYFSVFCVLIISMAMYGCGAKKMVKQAEEYESAGMFKDAAELYYEACLTKPDKPEIRIALKRSGQLALEDMAAKVGEAYSRGDDKKTVYEYVLAVGFAEKIEKAGINLNIDPAMKRQYEEAKNRYLSDRYAEGLRNLDEKNYDGAKAVFAEINEIDPAFRDTELYLDQATYEPVYQEAAVLFSDRKYMEAYQKWAWICQREKNYSDVAERMKQALRERYREGSLLLMDENFDGAAVALGEVYRADPDFEDVKAQYAEAKNEPVYRQAKIYLDGGKCRTAYFGFERILADAGTYKDCRELKDRALECARYPMAVHTPVFRNYNAEAIEFENALVKKLLDLDDPFLKVYDLTSIDSRIDRAIVDRSGNIDRGQLNQLADRHDIKAVLILDFSDFKKQGGRAKKIEKSGFERELVKTTTGQTSYVDKKVTYAEFTQKNKVELAVRYKLIDTRTGEILLSDSYSGEESDEMNYARYNGNPKALYPSIEINNTFSPDDRNYNKLQSLLRNDDKITSMDVLQRNLFSGLTGDIAGDIKNFNPER